MCEFDRNIHKNFEQETTNILFLWLISVIIHYNVHEKPMKKAIGYIRGRKYNGKWAIDRASQRQQLVEYAEAYNYELLGVRTEDQEISLKDKKTLLGLLQLLKRCKREKADFLYVDLGRYRRNIFFDQIIEAALKDEQNNESLLRTSIAIPASRATREALERHARYELYDYRYKRSRPKKKVVKLKDDTVSVWQPELGTLGLLDPEAQNLLVAFHGEAQRQINGFVADSPLIADFDPHEWSAVL